jgi:hypothetical protein
MTTSPSIPVSLRTVDRLAVASGGPFNVGFPVFSADGAELEVSLAGVPLSGWVFSGTLAAGFYGAPNTWINGTITLAVPVSGTITITSTITPSRESQYADGRGVPARDQNFEWNKLTAIAQELRRDADVLDGKALKVLPGQAGPVFDLDDFIGVGGQLGVDASGQGVRVPSGTPGATIVMTQIIDSTATGRSLLGATDAAAALGVLGSDARYEPWAESLTQMQALTSARIGNAHLITDPESAWRKGWYKRVAAEPTHAHKVQVDGVWFELDPDQALYSTMFGIPLDDTAAVSRHAAIKAMLLHAGGRPAFLRRGRYLLSSPVDVNFRTEIGRLAGAFWYPGPQLIGEGVNSSIIESTVDNASAIRFWGGAPTGVPALSEGTSLRDFRLICRAGGTQRSGIEMRGANRCDIHRLFIEAPYNGITFVAEGAGDSDLLGDCSISENYIGGNANAGIFMQTQGVAALSAAHVHLVRNFVNGGYVGIRLEGVDQIDLIDNKLVTQTLYNLWIRYNGAFQNRNVRAIGNEVGNNAGSNSAMIHIECLINGHFRGNRFVRNTTEVGAVGYELAGGAGRSHVNNIVEQDQWIITASGAFSPYNVSGSVPAGAASLRDPNYLDYVPTGQRVVSPTCWGAATVVTLAGAGVVNLPGRDLVQSVDITATGGTTLTITPDVPENSELVLTVRNATGSAVAIGLSSGFTTAGPALGSPAAGVRNTALFRLRGGTFAQVSPWVAG